MTIGQAEAYLDALAETFPEALFQGLNGGVGSGRVGRRTENHPLP